MKKIIPIILIICLIGIISACGCKMNQPKITDYPPNLSELEKKTLYKWHLCLYAQSFSKVDMRCSDILNDSQKYDYIIIYDTLKKEKRLPTLFNKTGEYEMTFDDFFKYVK